MKLKNNIVTRLRDGDYLHSFNPTAGRLAACLLGFAIQVQIRTPTEPRSHTGAHSHGHHTGSAAQQRPGAGGLQGGRARHTHASGEREGIASIAWAELRKCRAAGRSIDGGSESVTLAGLHSFLFSSIFGLQFASYRA